MSIFWPPFIFGCLLASFRVCKHLSFSIAVLLCRLSSCFWEKSLWLDFFFFSSINRSISAVILLDFCFLLLTCHVLHFLLFLSIPITNYSVYFSIFFLFSYSYFTFSSHLLTPLSPDMLAFKVILPRPAWFICPGQSLLHLPGRLALAHLSFRRCVQPERLPTFLSALMWNKSWRLKQSHPPAACTILATLDTWVGRSLSVAEKVCVSWFGAGRVNGIMPTTSAQVKHYPFDHRMGRGSPISSHAWWVR